VLETDEKGRVKLSMKVLLDRPEGEYGGGGESREPREPRRDRPEGRRDRGDRGDREPRRETTARDDNNPDAPRSEPVKADIVPQQD
jgi:polyribonucleotide nucleotidyltransferase